MSWIKEDRETSEVSATTVAPYSLDVSSSVRATSIGKMFFKYTFVPDELDPKYRNSVPFISVSALLEKLVMIK